MKQVSPEEMEVFEEIKLFLGDNENNDFTSVAPFPLLEKNAVEFLRYRAEVICWFIRFAFHTTFWYYYISSISNKDWSSQDVARSVTKIAVKEARAQDLRNEILNSEKLVFSLAISLLPKCPLLCDVPPSTFKWTFSAHLGKRGLFHSKWVCFTIHLAIPQSSEKLQSLTWYILWLRCVICQMFKRPLSKTQSGPKWKVVIMMIFGT